MLPIVHRELRVAARSPKLYARRLRWGLLQTALACWVLLISAGGFRPSGAQWFFSSLSDLALLLCLFEGLRKTADAISLEKREGTLGFLFLSTLTGTDVILGKLAGALVRSASVLLPFLPILAISLLVGGTTFGEFWRVALVLFTTLLLSLSLCLLVSALSREQSILASIIVLAGISIAPLFAQLFRDPNLQLLRLLSPWEVLEAAGALRFQAAPRDFWIGMALLSALSFVALTAAAVWVPRAWQVRYGRSIAPKRSNRNKRLLKSNPVLWLSLDARAQHWFDLLALVAFLFGFLPLLALWLNVGNSPAWTLFPASAAGILLLLTWLRVALKTSTAVVEARLNGTLELLLSTPLTLGEVTRGYWLAIWHMVRIPAAVILALLVCAFITSSESSIARAIWTSKLTVELLLQVAVLGTVAMWMGLKCQTRGKAVVYTLLLGGLLPWVVCIFTILVQVVLIARGLEQTNRLLRRIRTGGAEAGFAPVYRAMPNVPPVIR